MTRTSYRLADNVRAEIITDATDPRVQVIIMPAGQPWTFFWVPPGGCGTNEGERERHAEWARFAHHILNALELGPPR